MRHNFKVIPNVNESTCFFNHAKHNVDCKKTSCKQWIDNNESNNCVIIAVNQGPYTLQKIGKIFDLTRMRICQIEKDILDQLSTKLSAN